MMGPKRNTNMDKDKEQAITGSLNIESDNEDEDLRRQVKELQEKLKIATEEKNREKDRASARERELDALSNTLRRQEHSAAAERDVLVRDYQGRINGLLNGTVTPGTASSETQSNRENSPLNSQTQGQTATQQNGLRSQNSVTAGANNGAREHQRAHANYEVPMPRQALFDGKASWESFFQPFEALAQACRWDQNEKLFRLTSCLRGEAAEYAFGQLPQDTLGDFSQLEKTLEARYKEKRTSSSYVAELENRHMQVKEKLADYVADIKRLVIKGYPTADAQTREKINVRHFLKGLPDQQMAVAVGMREPATIDEARQILEMYNSLKDEVKGPRIRIVQPEEEISQKDSQYVTEKGLREFGTEIKSNIGKKIDALSQKLDKSNAVRGNEKLPGSSGQYQSDVASGGARPKKKIRCFSCFEENHISRNCPHKAEKGNKNGGNLQEN